MALLVISAGTPLGTRILAANEAGTSSSSVTDNGSRDLPEASLPFSNLASREALNHYVAFIRGFESIGGFEGKTVPELRNLLDEQLLIPGVANLRRSFDVEIRPAVIGGIQTDVIVPAAGVSPRNRDRVLINLFGGGFTVGTRYGGQMESIPIAAVGGFKVISVHYRQAPEYQFPAASEDVGKVYQALLKRYKPENIGIYGCSAGGMLAAQSIAWFKRHEMPIPGAVGIFSLGATVGRGGDSERLLAALSGFRPPPSERGVSPQASAPPLYFSAANLNDPLVSPADHVEMLAVFPPSLIISGTRDVGLSPAAYTHMQLVRAGASAELHVIEGAVHCGFAQPVVDPGVPETQHIFEVITRFFDRHLGRRSRERE